ncbi:hypothetical protein [Blastococcus sp. SYSU D00813]
MVEWRESYPLPAEGVPDRGVDNSYRLDGTEDRSGHQDHPGARAAPETARAVGDVALRAAKSDGAGSGWVETTPRRPIPELGALAVGAVSREAGDYEADSWPADRIKDLDVDELRRTGGGPGRFSERRMAWVPLEMVGPTDEVAGEPFKSGEPTRPYAEGLAALYAERGAHPTVDSVDPRMVGDRGVRLCEAEGTGLLDVTFGRHRVQAARELGLPAVLAEVEVFRTEDDATGGDGGRARRPGDGWTAV